MHTYRLLIETAAGAPVSELKLTVRDAARAQELARGILARHGDGAAADIFEGDRRLTRLTRPHPRTA